MKKPTAVLISDIHYNLQTLELADKAMNMAIDKATELSVDLIIAGDLHDTKANMRGECVARMLKTFTRLTTKCFIIRGNHCSINEKSTEHSLEFLRYVAGVYLIDKVPAWYAKKTYLVPYYHDPEELRKWLNNAERGATLIMHQGIENSYSGEYIQDKSAIKSKDVAGMRVISGHYHTRQTINLPDGGQWDYIGTPYTLNYAEAKDPTKGFQVLYNDGSLSWIPTNLRKHVVGELYASDAIDGCTTVTDVNKDDLLWIKIHGTKEELSKVTKDKVAKGLSINIPFRLDLMPAETRTVSHYSQNGLNDSHGVQNAYTMLDSLIDSLTNCSQERINRLKMLWRELK